LGPAKVIAVEQNQVANILHILHVNVEGVQTHLKHFFFRLGGTWEYWKNVHMAVAQLQKHIY
jgi:hypothetical protein